MAERGDSLFEVARWIPALEKYGAATQLTVQVYDQSGTLVVGPISPTPLFTLLTAGQLTSRFSQCARECLVSSETSSVMLSKGGGLAVVGTPLRLDDTLMGAAVAGFALTELLNVPSLERMARDHGIVFEAVWNLVRKVVPQSDQRLRTHGELLRVLGETLLSEQARAHEAARLYRMAEDA